MSNSSKISLKRCILGLAAAFVCAGGAIGIHALVSDTAENVSAEQNSSTTETEIEIAKIPYSSTEVEDSSLEYGETLVKVAGVDGEKTYTYRVTYANGAKESRELIDEQITQQPVTEIIAKGTKIVWSCVDATSYDKNPYNDNKCTSSLGEVVYVSDSESKQLDQNYSPGKSGHSYYNNK